MEPGLNQEFAELTFAASLHAQREGRRGRRRTPAPGVVPPLPANAEARTSPSNAPSSAVPNSPAARPQPSAEASARAATAPRAGQGKAPEQPTREQLSRAPVSPSGRPQTSPGESPQAPPSGAPGSPLPADLAPRANTLEELRVSVAACQACGLCETRQQTVFADGSGAARVLFVGEAPGVEEDASGLPFVGKAGQLLTDIITKGMQLRREDVYIANVLKCRPPENRDPEPSQKSLCTPWLERQIELIRPQVIIPLGEHASQHMLRCQDSMGRMRGRVHLVRGLQIVPTYDPAFLLRSPHMKKDCWADIKLAMGVLGLG